MVMTMKSEIVLGRDEDLHTLLHFARGYHPDEQLLEWGAPQPTGIGSLQTDLTDA